MKYTKFVRDLEIAVIKDNETLQFFPVTLDNAQYKEYLKWVALGNEANTVTLGGF